MAMARARAYLQAVAGRCRRRRPRLGCQREAACGREQRGE